MLDIPFIGAYELRKDLPLLLKRLQKEAEGLVVTRSWRLSHSL